MKSKFIAAAVLASVMGITSLAYADQVAGTETVGISIDEAKVAALGWSAEKQVLHKSVYNDMHKKIGMIEDVIISPEKSVSYAVIGVGGFLGMDRHDVLIPFNQLKTEGHKFVLPGATKATLKSLPTFDYTHHK